MQFTVEVHDEREIAEHDCELDELDPGDVLLPPEVFAILGSHGGKHVVEIHEDVHKRVQETDDNSLFTCEPENVANRL